MNQIYLGFEDFFDKLITSIPLIVSGVIIFLLFAILGQWTTRTLHKMIKPNEQRARKRKILIRFVRWTFYIFGISFALSIMGLSEAAKGIIAAGGLLTVILGFAFREIGENLLAGLFLSFSPIFDVGDLIESNGTRGVVKKINIRDVHIRSADGVDTFIPSAMIYKNQLHNYTLDGLRRARFVIGIDYRNDTKAARDLILKTIQGIKGVLDNPKASTQISAFTANYIELECFFWINVNNKKVSLSETRSTAMEKVRIALLENNFTLSSDITSSIEFKSQN